MVCIPYSSSSLAQTEEVDLNLQFDPRGRITLFHAFFELGLRLYPNAWSGREHSANPDPTQLEYEKRKKDVTETLESIEEMRRDSYAFDVETASGQEIQQHSKYFRKLLQKRTELRIERDALNNEYDSRHTSVANYARRFRTTMRLHKAIANGELQMYSDGSGFIDPRRFKETTDFHLCFYMSTFAESTNQRQARKDLAFFDQLEFDEWLKLLSDGELHIIKSEGADAYEKMSKWIDAKILELVERPKKENLKAEFNALFLPSQKQTFDRLWKVHAPEDWTGPGRR